MNLTEFAIDSYVLALPRTQPNTRLHPQWSGPYRVLENDAGKYKVKDLITDSYVLALPRTQPKTRLHPQWSGPYRVLENDAGKYKIKDKWYHVTQLKQF